MSINQTKKINFPVQLYFLACQQAEKYGFNFDEYLKFLIMKDVNQDLKSIEQSTEKSLGRAIEDVKQRKVTRLKSNMDIKNHFSKIINS